MKDKIIRSEVDFTQPLPFSPERLAEMVQIAEAHLDDLDDSDSPYLGDEAWENAQRGLFYRGKRPAEAVQVDGDILNWFRRQGADYQDRINGLLREEMRRARAASSEGNLEPMKKTA